MGSSARHVAMRSALDRILKQGCPFDLASMAAMTSEELASQLEVWHRFRAVADGSIVQLLGEVMRREDFRSDGAAKPEDWQVERFGVHCVRSEQLPGGRTSHGPAPSHQST